MDGDVVCIGGGISRWSIGRRRLYGATLLLRWVDERVVDGDPANADRQGTDRRGKDDEVVRPEPHCRHDQEHRG